MNKNITIGTIFSVLLLSGCGGGGATAVDDVDGLTPVTPLTESKTATYSGDGGTLTETRESGFDGDIQFINEIDSFGDLSYENFKLANEIPSINVVNIERTSSIDLSCDNTSIAKGTQTSNFLNGAIATSVVFENSVSISCTVNLESPLPSTISNEASIVALLEDWGDFESDISLTPGFVSTDCPQDTFSDLDNEIETNLDVYDACKLINLENYTITDDNNTVHNISVKETLDITNPQQ